MARIRTGWARGTEAAGERSHKRRGGRAPDAVAWRPSLALAWLSMLGAATACNADQSGGAGDDASACATDGDPGGAWNPEVVDYSDPGEPGPDPDLYGECLDSMGAPTLIVPHHQYLSPVHAIHMPTPPTGEILWYHGKSEERVWPIGADPSAMRRHPVPQCVPWTQPGNCVAATGTCATASGAPGATCTEDDECPNYVVQGYPDIFCSGHGLLATGEVFVAGGNVNGSDDVGLYEAFFFDPRVASATEQPYGWSRVGGEVPEDMEVDRWYPTLTGLPDGRVLISGGASIMPGGQNTFEVFDPSAPAGDQIDRLPAALDFDAQAGADMPLYPFMFVLPNGDVLYAGGEGAAPGAYAARVLVPSYSGSNPEWRWSGYSANSTIPGGSAVMFRPGAIVKSGGLLTDQGDPLARNVATNVTEVLDLSDYASDSYAMAPTAFTRHATVPGAMHHPRHFHTLTVLADGRVVATGGNMRGNDKPGDDETNPCEFQGQRILDIPCADGCPSVCRDDGYCSLFSLVACTSDAECPEDGTCNNGRCRKACTTNSDCPEISGESDVCWTEATCPASEDTEVCAEDPPGPSGPIQRCDPGNNLCFATHSAEIWDPGCETWTEYDEQEIERMYHSIALLLPDGRVISAGNGHERSNLIDQDNAEYFEPIYGDGAGPRPLVSVVDDDIDNAEDYTVHIPYAPGEVTVQLLNPTARNFHGVTLVRLGSVTHQFDQGQRYLTLDTYEHAPNAALMTLTGPEAFGNPAASAVAPPGYYMMFVWGDQTPSVGQYVHLGDPAAAEIWTAPVSALAANETSCFGEPLMGTCPSSAQQMNTVALPQADGPTGPVDGWNVLVPPGLVRNPEAPTAAELTAVLARAVAACEAEWANEPAIAANCDGPNAFATPVRFVVGSAPSLDLVLPEQQNGSGIFGTQKLATCQLGLDCCHGFDENLCGASPSRTTPADWPVGSGEEYRVALGATSSSVQIITGVGTYTSRLTGSIGYSFCKDGSAGAPCPFYVGSFDALAASSPQRCIT